MRSAAELVEAVQAAGGLVEVFPDGRAKITGSVPAELVEEIKAGREAFLEAWEGERRGRYLRVPPPWLPLRREPIAWRLEVRRRVKRFAEKQGEAVCAWVNDRAEVYAERMGWEDRAPLNAALADLLHWQYSHWPEPERQLAILGEVAETFQQMETAR